MSKILAVTGITGQQGASVTDFVLGHPELSKQYQIRGLARDPSKASAKSYQIKGVEIVKADLDDRSSLDAAFKGVHTVFGVTSFGPGGSKEQEIAQGKNMADAAVAAGASYFIFSTATHVDKVSGGTIPTASFWDAKAEVEQYIRALPIKSSFVFPASFYENLVARPPNPAGDGTYVVARNVKPDTKIPWIDVRSDLGKFVGAILAQPDSFSGKFVACTDQEYSMSEIVGFLSKATGATITFKEVSDDVFGSFMPPNMAPSAVGMWKFMREFGYYGPGQAEQVAWGKAQALAKSTTIEEFLTQNPLTLKK